MFQNQLRFFVFVTSVFSVLPLKLNETESVHHREKRTLIFNYGGLTKIVLGIGCPIDFAPPKPNKGNVVFGWNFQAQFQDPQTVISPLNALTGLSRKFEERKKRFIENGGDGSRQLVYSGLERMLDNHGRNGKACLLRSICEAAETSLRHNGLIGELVHIFLTPNHQENISNEYKSASLAGLHGADCMNIYSDCLKGHGLLDSISFIEH